MYKVCNQIIEQDGPQTVINQQWKNSQQENRENGSMADTTIIDL